MRVAILLSFALTLTGCLTGGAPIVPVGDSVALDAGADAATDGAPSEPGSVVVATFNVRRYFDTVCHSGQCGPGGYETAATPAAFEARTQEIAQAVLALGADVVLLQEIETQDCLDALAGRLGDDYPVRVLGEINTPASVDVAVVARGEVSEVVTHRADTPLVLQDGSETTFSRELLEVRLLFEGRPVVVVNAHFKSKSNDDPARRLAEAQATREILMGIVTAEPGAVVVLGGDLNDTPSSETLLALEGDGGLFRAASVLPPGADWTYLWQGSAQAIDHLYYATGSAGALVEDSVEIMRDKDGAWGGSDHAAVRARFQLPAHASARP